MQTQQIIEYIRVYYQDLAGNLFPSFTNEDFSGDTFASSDDLEEFRGVFQASTNLTSFPVLIAVARDRDEDEGSLSEADVAERPAKREEELARLRNGLAAIGLVEVACFEHRSGYALVVRPAAPELTSKKAAQQLTKLLWDLAE
jgi:hypothetical protein